MEDWQLRNIDSLTQQLESLIKYDTILAAQLRQAGLLNESEEAILDTKCKEDVIAALLGIVKTKKNGYGVLKTALQNAGQSGAVSLLETYPKQLNPFDGEHNINFHGRKHELANLRKFAKRQRNKAGSYAKYDYLTVISGMAGVGKTELCKRFVETWLQQEKLMNAIQIIGDSDTSIENSIRANHKHLLLRFYAWESTTVEKDINVVIEELLKFLSGHEIIFIFDNVDNTEIISKAGLLRTFMDLSFDILKHRPLYLITSRFDGWDYILENTVTYSLDNMNVDEATDWVMSALNSDKKISEELVSYLDRYTLAISQAISLIKQKMVTDSKYCIAEYMQDLAAFDKRLTLLQTPVSTLYDRSIFNTFLTSIEYVLKQDVGLKAFQCLAICAYIDPDSIEVSIFTHTNDFHERESILKALNLLRSCSLLSVSSNNAFKIHRVLQTVLQTYFSQDKNPLENMSLSEQFEDRIFAKTVNKHFSQESRILSYTLELLKIRRVSLVSHAAHVWRFAGSHQHLLKLFYKDSVYGRLQLSPLHILVDEHNIVAVNKTLKTMRKVFSREEIRKLINKVDNCGRTSVFLAASKGYSDLIHLLHTEYNADLSIRSSLCFRYFERLQLLPYESSNFTALHIAIYNNQVDVVEALLKYDSTLDSVISDTSFKIEKASYIAGMVGNLEMVDKIWPHDLVAKIMATASKFKNTNIQVEKLEEILITQAFQNTANILSQKISFWGNLFTFLVLQNVSESTLDLLLAKGLINLEIENSAQLLNQAARGNSVKAFIWLVRNFLIVECKRNKCPENNCKGACSIQINWNWTPLFEAARYGSIDVVKYILDNNGENGSRNRIRGLEINIDIQDDKGDTPLYQAAYNGHLETVMHLVRRGANINKSNKWGSTPIIAASLQAKFETVAYLALLENIIFQPSLLDESKTSILGMLNLTVLHAAVAYDSVEMTEFLISIFEVKEKMLMRCLLTNGLGTISLLHTAVVFDSPNVIKFLKKTYSKLTSTSTSTSNYTLWKSSKLDIVSLVETFIKLAENKNINLKTRVISGANFLIRFTRFFLGSNLSVTPYQVAMLLGHHSCAELFDSEDQESLGVLITKILKTTFVPAIKKYLLQMKQYLNLHGTKKEPIGGNVTELVSRTLLNW